MLFRSLEHYRPFFAALGNKPVGAISSELRRGRDDDGESALGDVVADAFLEAAQAIDPRTVAAFANSGGIRSDLLGQAPTIPGGPRPVVYSNAFDVLPFGNVVQIKTVTGETILRWLEQQFDNPQPPLAKIMQVAGVTYSYSRTRPAGQRIDRASVRIGGQPLMGGEHYRVVSSDFVWNGGDAFAAATEGTETMTVGTDVDVLVAYLGKHSPLSVGPQTRLRREP